jgi:hypothetical protein
MTQRFQLNIRVQVQETDENGRPLGYGGPGLTVEHVVTLGPLDFMGLAGVLGQFHDLAERIKAGQPEAAPPPPDSVAKLYDQMRSVGSELRDYLIWHTGYASWYKSSDHGYTKVIDEAKRFTATEALMLVLDRARNADPHDVYALVGVGKQD